MIYYYFKHYPVSRPKVGLSLEQALEKTSIEPDDTNAISPMSRDRLQIFHDEFFTLEHDMNQAQSALANHNNKVKLLFAYLKTLISMFCFMLNGKVSLGKIEPGDRKLYDLDVEDSNTPSITSYRDLRAWYIKIWKGEEARLSKGGPPILDPDVNEIYNEGSRFKSMLSTAIELRRRYHELRIQMKEKVDEGNIFVRRLWGEVEVCLTERFQDDKDALRREAREYGVVFYRRLPNGTEEPTTESASDPSADAGSDAADNGSEAS